MKLKFCILFCLLLSTELVFGRKDIDMSQFDDSSGNWFEKLNWLKKARELNLNIQKTVNNILSKEPVFKQLQQDTISKVTSFSKSSMLTLDKVTIKLKDLGLTEEEKKEYLDAKEKLEYLKKLESQINKSNSLFEKEVVKIQDFKVMAERDLVDIDNTRDGKKAKYLFDHMQNCLENLKQIDEYVSGNLFNYLQDLNSSALKVIKELIQIDKKTYDFEIAKQAQVKNLEQLSISKEANSGSWFSKLFASIKDFFTGLKRKFIEK